jgi:hypothetical protein
VSLHLQLNHTRAIITAYPPHYEPLQGLHQSSSHELDSTHIVRHAPTRLVARGFGDDDGVLRLGSKEVAADECSGAWAVPSLFWAAGFNFGRGMVVGEVPYDARLTDLFWGEEILMAVQLWSAGYDFFAPCDASIVLHHWSRAYRKTFWQLRQSTTPPPDTARLLRRLLVDPRARGPQVRRTRTEYEEYANISLSHGVAGDSCVLSVPSCRRGDGSCCCALITL